jgi:DNA-binding IclR family transcriptional regulator
LRDETRETLILGKLATDSVLYLDVVESTETVRYSAAAGQFKPVHAAASGKALLSAMSREERGEFISRLTLDRRSPTTITDPDELERNIVEGITRGWQMSRGENAPDATSIAVPVRIAGDVVVLAVAGLSARMDVRVEAIAAHLVTARLELESS